MIVSRRAWTTALASALIVLVPLACSAGGPPERFVAGQHFTELEQPVTRQNQKKIEVIEFFLYSCAHCDAFDPAVSAWAEKLPDDAQFRRVPVLFSALGPLFARMFYTARDLGVLDEMHERMFAAIHDKKRDLTTPGAIRALFVENGISGEDFDASFDSKKVKAQVAQAAELMRAYRIDGVPALAVDGKYTLNGRQAGSNDAMLEVADFLINKARSAR